MHHMVPFSELKGRIKVVSVKGQLKVDLNYDEFLDVVRQLLHAVAVDEEWYLKTYPDVAEAVSAGIHSTAAHHFVENGYAEGRRPFFMTVDEDWYLKQYPDVGEGIATGEFASAQDHFSKHGYEEGRRPGPA